MGLVVDTSAFIAVQRAGKRWDNAIEQVRDEAAVIPAIVYAELLVGVRLAERPQRAARRRAQIERRWRRAAPSSNSTGRLLSAGPSCSPC